MKKFNLLNIPICSVIILFAFISCGNIALADTWTKVYGSNSTDDIYSIELTSDGYILNGYTSAGEFGDLKGISVKLDNYGNKEWVKTFGKESASANIFDILKSIDTFSDGEITSDGGYIIAGDSTSYSATNDYESLIIKFNSEGNEEWAKTYINGYNKNSAMSIKEVSDGYIITGWTNNSGAASNRIFVFKIDSNGDVTWARAFGVINIIDRQTDSGGVIEVSDGYIISGRTYDGTSFIPVFLKLDKNGNKVWAKTITLSSGYDVISGIIETSNDNYIGTGFMSSGTNKELVVFKMDGNGNKIWAKNYGGAETDIGLSIVENSLGEFVVVGYTRSFGAVLNDGFIMKIDSVGNKLSARTFGGDKNDLLTEVHKTSDGYVAVGTTASFSGGNNDALILKFDENLDIQGCDDNFNVINIASINSSVILTNTVNVPISSFHNIDGDMIVSIIDPEGTNSDLGDVFACGVDNTSPTLATEAWIPDDTTGTEIIDGRIVDLENIDEIGEFITIYSTASDDSGIQDHKITYWKNGVFQDTDLWITSGTHSITINGPLADGDVIEYQAQATDNVVPPNTAYDPADGVTKYSFTVREACVIDSIPDLIMTGGSDDDKFGASVASGGDLNGDGYDDIVVGTCGTDNLYVYFGGPGADNVADLTLSVDNALGPRNVSIAGDFNGDDYDDIVVGDYSSDNISVFYGGSSMDNVADLILDRTADGGVSGNAHTGYNIDLAGDFNGDGYNDVIAGTGVDRGYVYFGGLLPDKDIDLILTEGVSTLGNTIVSSAGDINGDGYDDVIIGGDCGVRAVVFYGGASMNNTADITINDTSFVDQERVAYAGDVNGDGYDDIITASPYEGLSTQGEAHIYYGSSSMSTSYLPADADVTFTYPTWTTWLEIASVGDINNDGYDDIIIGDTAGHKAYVYYGGLPMDNTADMTFTGADASWFGWSISSLGDFNGNGVNDIVVGDPYFNGSGTMVGQVSVYQCLPPNTPPIMTSIIITPDPAYTNNDLMANPAVIDADGDPITYSYQWKNNDVDVGADSPTLLSVNFAKDDVIEVVVTPNDGINDGLSMTSDSLTISNSAPTQPMVSISPDPAANSDDLDCQITASSTDADGDSITYTYEWFVGANPISQKTTANTTNLTDTLLAASTATDETWTCVVTPNDGTDDGPYRKAAVIIDSSNSLPVMASVTITPDPAYANNDIIANPTATDADGDLITYSYQWRKNGANIAGETNQILLSANFAKDDAIEVSVTPNDGTNDGLPMTSDLLIISNSAPTQPTVSIAPNPAYENDDLICSPANSTDIDGDPINYLYEWYKDGAIQASEITNTINSALTATGETWRCRVTPNDGTDDGSYMEDSTVILQIPTANFPSITITAKDKDDNIILNEALISSILANPATIDFIASDSDGVINTHTAYLTNNNWAIGSVETVDCGVSCSINICDYFSCPLTAGTVIKYKSEATDNDINTVYAPEQWFEIIAPPNTPPAVTTNSVLPIDYCASNLPAGVELMWDFIDNEDGTVQTGYEINLMRDGVTLCNIVKNPDNSNSITGPEINALCPGFIDYGNHTYTWEVKVYDSAGADSGFIAEPSSFPSSSTPNHRFPTARFEFTPMQPPAIILQFQPIDFDPILSQAFGGFTIINWAWNFGDGSPLVSIGNPPNTDGKTTYSYSEAILHTVDLKVTDSSPQAYSCWASDKNNEKDVNIGENKPKWNEINP